MQVQSATDTPKKIALGERAVMVDGAGYLVIRYKEEGQPVEIVYPAEGTPLATGPSAVFKAAPNPNAARLFQNWMHSREAQQILVDCGAPVFGARADRGEAGRPHARRHQADEGGPGGRREGRRGRSRSATRRSSRCMTRSSWPRRAALDAAPRTASRPSLRARPGRPSDDASGSHDIALPRRAERHGFDYSSLVLYVFAALLCVLIVLPMSWLVYYSFSRPRTGALHARQLRDAVHRSRRSLDPLITTIILATLRRA